MKRELSVSITDSKVSDYSGSLLLFSIPSTAEILF